MKRLLYILPVLGFVALAIALFYGVANPRPPNELPSMLIGKPVPALTLPSVNRTDAGLTPDAFRTGHVVVLNVWASWCAPCRAEMPLLDALGRDKAVTIYGLVYKDTAARARAFLGELGNPFSRIGLDASGDAGIEWGISGVPETFVIDGDGIVRARIVGALTDGDKFRRELLPALAEARRMAAAR